MRSTVEDVSVTKKRITIEATADEIEEEIQKALKDVRAKTNLPGFRPGKVPLSLIDKRYGKEIEKDVFSTLIQQYYFNAVKESNLKPLIPPVFEESDLRRKQDLRVVCSVEVRPLIEDLAYENLSLKENEIKVEDEEIETHLKNLLMSRSTYEPVERHVQEDDLVVVDSEVSQDSKTYTDQFLKVSGEFLPEKLYQALTGKKKGDQFEETVEFPKGFSIKEFGGRTLDLRSTVKDIKELVTPELDDEFAKDVGLESLEELRGKVKEGLEASKKDIEVKQQKGELIKALVEKYSFEVPETILNDELKAIVNEVKRKEDYKDKPEGELEDQFRDEANKNVKAMILIDTIGERENITVSDDEVQQRLIMLSQSMSMAPEALAQFYSHRDGSLDGLRYTLFREKVADFLYTKASQQKENA